MGGRADKLFIIGTGVGGHLALLTAFYSQHVFGGVFCCDAIMPDGLVAGATGGEGGAIYPNFEAKKNMFICVTKWKGKISESDVAKAQQQAQQMRGSGFLRLSLKEVKKSMDRAIAQVHPYSRCGSQYEVDRLSAFREARSGKFDKQAQQKYGTALAATSK